MQLYTSLNICILSGERKSVLMCHCPKTADISSVQQDFPGSFEECAADLNTYQRSTIKKKEKEKNFLNLMSWCCFARTEVHICHISDLTSPASLS